MTKAQHNYNGPVLALSSAFLFGASTPIAKLLLGFADPLLLAGLLYLGAGAGLALVETGGRSLGLGRSEAPLRAPDLPWLAAIILFGGVLGPALLMWGLTFIPASTGALLLNTEGLAAMAIAWLVFRENVDRRIFLGAMAILAGAVVLSWPDAAGGGAPLSWGSVLIVLACVSWGIDNNLTRKLSAADPLQTAMIKGLAAGAVNLALGLAHGAALPGLTTLARRGRSRLLRLRRQSGALCAGPAALGGRTDRRLLLDGSLYRRSPSAPAVWREAYPYSDRRGGADGGWRLSAPRRGARP